ncbi:hypothetical protein LX36DRAFT_667750 [Colletotrichum falcatum]|nr:hypothetical protein LX36DRAFT_667750 [Colletotrichum falcatum]
MPTATTTCLAVLGLLPYAVPVYFPADPAKQATDDYRRQVPTSLRHSCQGKARSELRLCLEIPVRIMVDLIAGTELIGAGGEFAHKFQVSNTGFIDVSQGQISQDFVRRSARKYTSATKGQSRRQSFGQSNPGQDINDWIRPASCLYYFVPPDALGLAENMQFGVVRVYSAPA